MPENFSANDMRGVAPEYIASLVIAEQADDCISWGLSLVHIDGDDVFYH